MKNALKLIISKSPAAAGEAMQTLRAISAKSPILQLRYNRTVEMALSDPEAEFTPAERAQLTEFVELPDHENRGHILTLRLTLSEYASLSGAAELAGLTTSEYARRKIFE